jgi:hypothetical protein
MATHTQRPATAWPQGAPVVGQAAARSRRILAADIERFTAISGDRNPLHYDAEVRPDKPVVRLTARVTRDDGTVCVTGEVVTYTFALTPH